MCARCRIGGVERSSERVFFRDKHSAHQHNQHDVANDNDDAGDNLLDDS
jgi:hypothetical protein